MDAPGRSRFLRALLFSAVVLGAMFLLFRKCMSFWLTFHRGHWQFPLWYAAAIMSLPPLWAFAFLMMRWKSRLTLVVCSVTACLVWLAIPDNRLIPIPALESSVVKSLVQARAALVSDRGKHIALGFADALPNIESAFPTGRFYDVAYRPHRLPDGRIERFEIAATLNSGARSCGCSRNFTIDMDGLVHYTSESRPATSADPVVDLPPALTAAER